MRVCSLFCGIGGIDLAFTQAGHKILWANDIDKYACMTYRHNFPETVLVEGDIRAIDKRDIPDFDILAAGFPCQPFSVCGKQKGFSDERGNLFFEIGKVIDAKHPSIVFLENVANLTEHDHGKTFNVIHNELARRGYFIRYLVADACDYGIPQHRTRTYIVAFSDRTACESFTFSEKSSARKTNNRYYRCDSKSGWQILLFARFDKISTFKSIYCRRKAVVSICGLRYSIEQKRHIVYAQSEYGNVLRPSADYKG